MSTAASRPSAGRVVVGLVLVAVGIAWLLAATGAVEVEWRFVLPVALVVVGLALLGTARGGGSGPLVALGVILSVLAVLTSLLSPAFTPAVLAGGIGDRDVSPDTLDGPAEFSLAIGELTVDLGDTHLEDADVAATVGIGRLVVEVPSDVDVVLEAAAGAGEVSALDVQRNGVGPVVTRTFPAEGRARATLHLTAAVTLGRVEVQR